MSEVVAIAVPEQARDYVRKGREAFPSHFPGQDFDAPVWDLTPLKKRAHSRSNAKLYWTLYGSKDEPLPARFVEPIKAACVLDLQSSTNLRFRASAARMLWDHLRTRTTPETFQWADVTEEDMLGAEEVMRQHWAAKSTYKTCVAWNRVLELLATAGVVRPMNVPWRTPRPEDSERHTIAGQEERQALLPSDEAIDAVAAVYREYATEPPDRLLACVLAILLATGLRIGEVLTLPYDCLIYTGGETGRDRKWGLRYFKEKGGVLEEMEPLWLAPGPASLVREAVREIRKLTRSARARARVLADNPGRAPLPGIEGNARLTPEQAAEATGIKKKDLFRSPVPRHGSKAEGYFYLASEVEAWLVERQGDAWSITLSGGTRQHLADTLFVVHRNFFHPKRGTLPLLIDSVTQKHVSDFLGGRWERAREREKGAVKRNGRWKKPLVRSVFQRFDLREKDGSVIELTTHQFRHWVTTNLRVGGTPDSLIARWQNRRHQGDLNAYKHLTLAQRVETVRDALVSGRLRGELADTYFALAEDVRDVWLEEQVQHVHVTDMGLCTHDFSVSPCPYHLNCLKGCPDYHHDTADPVQRQQLIQLKVRTKEARDLVVGQAEKEGVEVTENWLQDYDTVIENAERILESEPEAGTSLVQPFATGSSRFNPTEENGDGSPDEEG